MGIALSIQRSPSIPFSPVQLFLLIILYILRRILPIQVTSVCELEVNPPKSGISGHELSKYNFLFRFREMFC